MVAVTICDKDASRANKLAEQVKEFYKEEKLATEPTVKIVNEIRTEIMLIPKRSGFEKVYVKDVNFVCIEGRSIEYHMHDVKITSGVTLRGSFRKALGPHITNPKFYFIEPSLLIYMPNVQNVEREKITFFNGDVAYYPRRHYELLLETLNQGFEE